MALSWTAPANSASISNYQVRHRVSDAAQDWPGWSTVSDGSSASDTTITGLTNGVPYQFEVQAVDSQGASVAVSNIISATPAAVPGAPPHFRPSPGDGQVVLRWDAAAANGSLIKRYEVQRRVASSGHGWPGWSTVPDGSTARDTTVTGLTNGVLYEFAVRAVNGVGAGAQASQSATPQAATVTLSLTASRGDGQVALSWTVSAHSASIRNYQVRHRVSDSGHGWPSWSTVSGGSSASDTTVTGLTNGVTYQFQVQAINSAGSSVAVSNVESATPQMPGTEPVPALVDPITCYVGEYCSYTFPEVIRGTPPISYSVSPPSWASSVSGSRSFSGTAPSSPGTYSASLNASNAYGSDSESLTINVKRRGVAPVPALVDPITCYVGEYCSYTFPEVIRGTPPISYSVSPPSWASSVSGSRSFSGTAPSSPGTYSASLNASNAYGSDSESLTINVRRRAVAGVAPVLPSVSSITCYVSEYCSYTFPAASRGTAPISYSVSSPSWASSVSGSRSFSGTAPSSPGTFSASLNASNAYGSDSESLTINVRRRAVAGVAPVLPSVSSITCYVSEYCSYTFPAASRGTAPISYSVSSPSWASSVSGSRSFSGTAPSSPGTFSASLNASNAYGSDSESLTINVRRRAVAGVAPVLPSVSSITCYVGEYCSYTFPAASSGTAPISYSVSSPSWASSVSGSRSFSGTAPSSPGTFSASLNASNAYGSDSESLTINVVRRSVTALGSLSSLLAESGVRSPHHLQSNRPVCRYLDGADAAGDTDTHNIQRSVHRQGA